MRPGSLVAADRPFAQTGPPGLRTLPGPQRWSAPRCNILANPLTWADGVRRTRTWGVLRSGSTAQTLASGPTDGPPYLLDPSQRISRKIQLRKTSPTVNPPPCPKLLDRSYNTTIATTMLTSGMI